MQNIKVSAILLTIGEATFHSAYESLKQQSYPLEEIITIENSSPFSNAFNEGVAKVKTPYFLQCDADMILANDCLERLVNQMDEETGISIGRLYDPLQGQVQGIKLYRTKCCVSYPHEDVPHCGRKFRQDLKRNQWKVIVSNNSRSSLFGTHRIDVSDRVYLFERFKYLGNKLCICKEWEELTETILRFRKSDHPELVPMICVAFISGLFLSHKKDHLSIYQPSFKYQVWEQMSRYESKCKKAKKKMKFGYGNYFLGYTRAALIKSGVIKESPSSVIQMCIQEKSFSEMCYLIGFCGGLLTRAKLMFLRIIIRFVYVYPFLRFIKGQLDEGIDRAEADPT